MPRDATNRFAARSDRAKALPALEPVAALTVRPAGEDAKKTPEREPSHSAKSNSYVV